MLRNRRHDRVSGDDAIMETPSSRTFLVAFHGVCWSRKSAARKSDERTLECAAASLENAGRLQPRPKGPLPLAGSPLRFSRSLSKSAPAWCDERVSGDDATMEKPLA